MVRRKRQCAAGVDPLDLPALRCEGEATETTPDGRTERRYWGVVALDGAALETFCQQLKIAASQGHLVTVDRLTVLPDVPRGGTPR